jgi:hypothetical protein
VKKRISGNTYNKFLEIQFKVINALRKMWVIRYNTKLAAEAGLVDS